MTTEQSPSADQKPVGAGEKAKAKKFQIFLTGGDMPKIVKNPSEKDKWMVEIYSSDFYIQSL